MVPGLPFHFRVALEVIHYLSMELEGVIDLLVANGIPEYRMIPGSSKDVFKTT